MHTTFSGAIVLVPTLRVGTRKSGPNLKVWTPTRLNLMAVGGGVGWSGVEWSGAVGFTTKYACHEISVTTHQLGVRCLI